MAVFVSDFVSFFAGFATAFFGESVFVFVLDSDVFVVGFEAVFVVGFEFDGFVVGFERCGWLIGAM